MVQSVERACQRVEGEEVGCICRGTSPKADSSMLHCGSCEEWYAVVALSLQHSLNLCTSLDSPLNSSVWMVDPKTLNPKPLTFLFCFFVVAGTIQSVLVCHSCKLEAISRTYAHFALHCLLESWPLLMIILSRYHSSRHLYSCCGQILCWPVPRLPVEFGFAFVWHLLP